MLCLEDLSSNVLCRNGRGRKKASDLIFCILEGKTKFADGVGAEMLALLISTVKSVGKLLCLVCKVSSNIIHCDCSRFLLESPV